ncbi:inclusion body protein [Burkholderia cenocepacia]|nr:inclusion body protein [Burkholderia cenocepacia]
MASEITLASSAQDINIIAVIDTEWVKKTYPNPSQNQAAPTGIAHNGQFLICTGARGVKGQGTADLEITAYPGDRVQFTGVSIYDNSDDAVIIYNIPAIKATRYSTRSSATRSSAMARWNPTRIRGPATASRR